VRGEEKEQKIEQEEKGKKTGERIEKRETETGRKNEKETKERVRLYRETKAKK
jgi:hypothetical protein